jgi:hypothetical protein
MKIVVQTSRRLELESGNPLGAVAGTLFGMLFLVAGVAAILLLGRLTVLMCQRLEPNQIECQLTSTGLLGSQTTQITALEGAEVATHSDDDGDTYSIVLFAVGQKIPFSKIRSSGYAAKKANADRINAFVNNSQQSALSVQEDHRWFSYLFGSGFALTGGALVLASWRLKFITYAVFDKNLGRLTLRRQSALGQTQTQSWNLQEIVGLSVKEEKDSDGDRTYKLLLKLKSGQQLPLSRLFLNSQPQAEAIAAKLRQFLGLTAI